MSKWAALAKREILERPLGRTDETDESTPKGVKQGVSSVLSVTPPAPLEKSKGVSSVSSVPTGHLLEKCNSLPMPANDPSAEAWTCKEKGKQAGALWDMLQAMGVAPNWSDQEVYLFNARVSLYKAKGMTLVDGEALAERLQRRDREKDDRRACIECANLTSGGRCLEATRGRIVGASWRLEPVPTVLQRCEGFKPTD